MSFAVTVGIGVLIGISLGALGAGGSILAVPALVHLLDQPPDQAMTASLVIVGVSALTGALSQRGTGRLKVGQGLTFSLIGIAGSWAGVALAAGADPGVLMAAFAALMLLVAGTMGHGLWRTRRDPRPGTTRTPAPVLTLRPFTVNWRRLTLLVVAATVVGVLTGFFGVGGGFLIVPALTVALGFPMPTAVATSLVVIAANSGITLGMRTGQGMDLDWFLVGGLALAAIAGGLLGGRVARRVRPRTLSIAFVLALVVIAGWTAAGTVPQLT